MQCELLDSLRIRTLSEGLDNALQILAQLRWQMCMMVGDTAQVWRPSGRCCDGRTSSRGGVRQYVWYSTSQPSQMMIFFGSSLFQQVAHAVHGTNGLRCTSDRTVAVCRKQGQHLMLMLARAMR